MAAEVWHNQLLPDTLSSTGLWSEGELSCLIRMDLDDPQVRMQDAQFRMTQEMALTLMHFKLLYASPVMFTYPLRLVLLLGSEEEQNQALVHLHQAYEASLEAARRPGKWCKGFSARSPFNLQIMKDIIAHLQRSQWQMTKSLSQFLREVFHGFGATWNEEGFSRLRQEETRANKAHDMSSCDAWQCLSLRKVLPSAGFTEISTDPTQPPIKLPESLYHVQHRAPSMTTLKTITGTMTWPSPTQQSLGGLACEMCLLMDSHAKNNIGLLKESWRTALLRRGLVVQMEGSQPKLSLGPWPGNCGALLLPLKEMEHGFEMTELRSDNVGFAQVSDFKSWFVIPCEARSPLHHFLATKQRDLATVPLLCKVGSRKPLLTHAAECAFWDLPVSVLSMLAKDFQVRAEAESSDAMMGELVLVCVEKALGLSREKAADVMETNLSHRHNQHKKDLLELLQQPAFQDLVQARDEKEVQEALREAKASEQVFLSVAGAISRVRKRSGKARKAAKRKPISLTSVKVFDTEKVSNWLPDDTYRPYRDNFNQCWRVFHRSGWNMSRSWGQFGGKEAIPIRVLLVAAWERHKLFHPDVECPFEFQEISQ